MTPDPAMGILLDNLYLDLLNGSFTHPDQPAAHREALLGRLRAALKRVTAENLAPFLTAGWRERAAACWLLGLARLSAIQSQVGELLLASAFPHVGPSATFALLRFDAEASTAFFCAYLDTYLPRTDLDYDQAHVLAALVLLDRMRGTQHAAPYLSEAGPWDRFVGGRQSVAARLPACVTWCEQALTYCGKHFDR